MKTTEIKVSKLFNLKSISLSTQKYWSFDTVGSKSIRLKAGVAKNVFRLALNIYI